MPRLLIRFQAAIVEQDQVLLLRVNDIFTKASFWVFPGGAPEASETPEMCVQREVFEETSLRVDVQQFLFTAPDLPNGIYEQLHTYLCHVRSGIAVPGIEPEVDTPDHITIQDVGWFDLRAPATWPALIRDDPLTYPLLQRLRSALGYASA